MKSFQQKYNLPPRIKVSIKKGELEGFIVSLPGYPGCITYAENIGELIDIVNDVILTYFKVSREEALKADIVYVPSIPDKSIKKTKKVKNAHESLSEFIPYSPYYA